MYKLINKDKMVCVILSGGLSSRMESHKALLSFSASHNFLQHIIDVYHTAGIENIFVVKNKEIDLSGLELEKIGIRIVNNYYPEKGRLYSIQLGLLATQGADFCFIQNIDNPFVTSGIIQQLAAHKIRADYISPDYNGHGGHPVLLSSGISRAIADITDYNKTLREVLSKFNRFKLITEDDQCIRNINTPQDYEEYFSGYKTHIT